MAQTLFICIRICQIWMYEKVWGWYQPQPWCNDIIFTPQATQNSQIWGQLGRCNGIRVHPCAIETAYQWLTHLHMSNIDVGSGLRWMLASNMTLWHHIFSTSDPDSNIWGRLGQCNGVRLHPYTPRTANHTNGSNTFYMSNMDVGSNTLYISNIDVLWSEVDIRLN